MLKAHRFVAATAQHEIAGLGSFLDRNAFFGEREVVAEFKHWPNLTVMLGGLCGGLILADAFQYEFQLEGLAFADLVLRGASRRTVVFVEFEGGRKDSIFSAQGRGRLSRWSREIEHATSQIIDWSWVLSESRHSRTLLDRVGVDAISAQYLVICGRSRAVSFQSQSSRFEHRRAKLTIGGDRITFMTYDDVHTELAFILAALQAENLVSRRTDADRH